MTMWKSSPVNDFCKLEKTKLNAKPINKVQSHQDVAMKFGKQCCKKISAQSALDVEILVIDFCYKL